MTIQLLQSKNVRAKWPATATSRRNRALGRKPTVFLAGTLRYINVASRLLLRNLNGEKVVLPVMCVRDASHPEVAYAFAEVEVLGPCDILYTPEAPLPGTNGRGIAYMHTSALVRGWRDPRFSEPPKESEL